MKYVLSLAAIFISVFSTQHQLVAEQYSNTLSHQQCLKSAQDNYDNCIELASEMKNDGSEHVHEYSNAQALLQGGCQKNLQKELSACKISSTKDTHIE